VKKELFAVGLLLFLVACAALNIKYVERIESQITTFLELSENAANEGNFQLSIYQLDMALDTWHNAHNYTQIFLRQPEVDAVEDNFRDLEEHLLEKKTEGLQALYAKLKYHIKNIAYMEKPSLPTVL